MKEENTITLSVKRMFLIIVVFLILFFTVIRPSVARGVCYQEALRRDLFEFFANPEKSRQNNRDKQDNVNKLYEECKVYNVGKIWEKYFLDDMKL